MSIKRGDEGQRVKEAQRALVTLGYSLPRFGVDGDYGRETERAIGRWASERCIAREPWKLHEEARIRLIREASDQDMRPSRPAVASIMPNGDYLTVHGVDTSGHQPSRLLDLTTMAESGFMRWHMVKNGEDGRYVFGDCADRLDALRSLGVLCGEYHFLRPEDGVDDDLENWKAHTTYQPGDLPPMVDFEKGRRIEREGRSPAPATSVMANKNLEDLLRFGEEAAAFCGVRRLILYTTLPSWQWYAANADQSIKDELPGLFDLMWADYVRDRKGISGNIDLLRGFKHSDFKRAQRDGLPYNSAVIHQWTGKGRVPGYDRNIDRCLMSADYFDKLREPFA